MSNIAGGEPLGIAAIFNPDSGKSTIRDDQLQNLRTRIQHAAVRILGEIPDEPEDNRTPHDVRQAMVSIGQGHYSALARLDAAYLERIALQLGDSDSRITNLLGVVYVAHEAKQEAENAS